MQLQGASPGPPQEVHGEVSNRRKRRRRRRRVSRRRRRARRLFGRKRREQILVYLLNMKTVIEECNVVSFWMEGGKRGGGKIS